MTEAAGPGMSPAGQLPAGEPVSRSIAYLRGFRAAVAGTGAVASVAAGVLSVLGATVETVASELDLDPHANWDAVICDRVSAAADQDYLELVARSLSQDARSSCWVTVTGFGLSGPAASYRGSDLVCAAAGGLLAAVSDGAGRVYPTPGEQALQSAGYAAALAALHGISLRRSRGTPVHLDLSAQEAVAFCTNQQTPSHILHNCGIRAGAGRYSAPSGPFPCRDGYIQIIVVDNHQFAAFAKAIGEPDWIQFFPQVADRVASAEMIDAVVAEWSSTWAKDECEQYLQAAGVSATAVQDVADVATTRLFRGRGWALPAAGGPQMILPALVTSGPGQRRASAAQPVLGEMRVLESSNVLAGPLSGAILGALGANVVRVEPTERLDLYRQNGPFAGGIPGIERGAYFQGANYNKRSVTEGVARAHGAGALGWADVILENTGRKRLEQSGIAPAAGPSPDQFYLSISAFGRKGPGAAYRGYAPNVHAAAGYEAAIVGVAGRDITIRNVAADYETAIWAATLAAAWWLGGGKDAQAIDLSMAEVVATRMIGQPTDSPPRDEAVVDLGGRRFLAITAPAGTTWPEAVARALGGGPGDSAAAGTAESLLRERAEQDIGHLVADLQAADVAAYVAVIPEALPDDPQLAARGTFVALPHPVVGLGYLLALPWAEAGSARSAWYRRAPLLGEHDKWAAQAWGGSRGGAAPAHPPSHHFEPAQE
jgi:crotonobetainyl-CoA:carnitine CoA-transferase CaiB-like acyl-CoA transferase